MIVVMNHGASQEHVQAVIESASIRLRPVLMTSLCTAFGAVPLMVATGAGAESRQSIGAAVFFGTLVCLALTLFVVPSLYALIARNTRSPHYVGDLLDKLLARSAREPAVPAASSFTPPSTPA